MSEDPKFKIWLTRETFRRRGIPSAEERVVKDMEPENLKVETRDTGRWEEVED
jgi:hypothetical protein